MTTSGAPREVSIYAAWQPSERDLKLLKRHLLRKCLRAFFPSTGRNMGLAAFFMLQAKAIHRLTGVPELVCIFGWPAVVILAYLISSWLQVRRDTVAQSYLRSVTITPDALTVSGVDVRESALPQVLSVKRTTDGVFIDRLAGSLFIPVRAFEGDAGAIAFEDAYRLAKDTANDIRIPPRPAANDFPFSILIQPSKADVIHAYYGGWSRAYCSADDRTLAFVVLFLPIVMCIIIASVTQNRVVDAVLAALVITVILGIGVGLYRLSPAFPLNVAQRRHPLRQPLRVGVGPVGVTIYYSNAPHVFAWGIVQKLDEDGRLIYIQLPGDLILIPKSCFLDEGHAAEFFDAAKAYQRGETPIVDSARAAWPPSPDGEPGAGS